MALLLVGYRPTRSRHEGHPPLPQKKDLTVPTDAPLCSRTVLLWSGNHENPSSKSGLNLEFTSGGWAPGGTHLVRDLVHRPSTCPVTRHGTGLRGERRERERMVRRSVRLTRAVWLGGSTIPLKRGGRKHKRLAIYIYIYAACATCQNGTAKPFFASHPPLWGRSSRGASPGAAKRPARRSGEIRGRSSALRRTEPGERRGGLGADELRGDDGAGPLVGVPELRGAGGGLCVSLLRGGGHQVRGLRLHALRLGRVIFGGRSGQFRTRWFLFALERAWVARFFGVLGQS